MIGILYLKSESAAPRLRVGLLVDGDHVTAAEAVIIDHIQACDFAEIILVIRRQGRQDDRRNRHSLPVRAAGMLRDPARRRRMCYAAYARLENWLTGNTAPDPLRRVNYGRIFANIENLAVQPQTDGFPPAAVEAIRARKIDVLLRFGFDTLRGEILAAARYGIWSYHYGDPEFYRGAPSQFWEMAERNPLSGAALQILHERPDGGLTLEKGLFATDLSISLRRNRIQVLWGSTHFVIAKLKMLHENGFEHLIAHAPAPRPYRGRQALYQPPSNGEMLGWLLGTVFRKLAQRLPPRQVEHWQIALRRAPDPASGLAIDPERERADLAGFQFLASPRGRVYADPFVFWQGERPFLFFEDDSYGDDPAVISVAEITPNGIGPARTCLNTGKHLSFPQVFEWDGEIYLMPESLESGEIALYRAVDFPLQWEKADVLYKGQVVDAALWHDRGQWYLFTTLVCPLSRVTSLHLFTADALGGPWQPHPQNPLSNDVRKARGGGAPFRRGERLFRPSQDCSGTYGRALEFHAVDVLTPTAYAEHRVLTITPDDVPAQAGAPATGIHTYHEARGIEAIDAKFLRPARQVM